MLTQLTNQATILLTRHFSEMETDSIHADVIAPRPPT
jgi:hypothetical protein